MIQKYADGVKKMKRQLPKNVRQIGNVSDSSKIYVEDYVDTFFNQLCDKAEQEMRGAFLIGETVQEEEQDYIYVYGAIRMKQLVIKGKDIIIEESVWKDACEKCKEYFGDAEILGWFIAGGDKPLEVNHNIKKMHQKYFTREKSLFVTKNARDKEENFYIYKYKDMMECGGHYIYYEKNLEMQNYMISTRKKNGLSPSETIEDRVAKNFRSIIREREEKKERRSHSRLVYAMSTFLVLVIMVIGVTTINNYEKMKDVQNSMSDEEESEGEGSEVIQTIGGVTNDESPKLNEEEKPKQNEIQEPTEEVTDPKQPQENTENNGNTEPDTTHQNEVDKPTTQAEAYIVQKGDTLETISREKYGDTAHVDAICEANGLEDGNLIYIGQKLLLP